MKRSQTTHVAWFMVSRCFCVLMTATTLFWAPPVETMYSVCQNMIFVTENAFHTANQIFDNVLNVLIIMNFTTSSKCCNRRIKVTLLKL